MPSETFLSFDDETSRNFSKNDLTCVRNKNMQKEIIFGYYL